MANHRLPQTTIGQIVALAAQGKKSDWIAAKLQISNTAARKYAMGAGLIRPRKYATLKPVNRPTPVGIMPAWPLERWEVRAIEIREARRA